MYLPWTRAEVNNLFANDGVPGREFDYVTYFCIARYEGLLALLVETAVGRNIESKKIYSYTDGYFSAFVRSRNLTEISFEEQVVEFVEHGLKHFPDKYSYVTISEVEINSNDKILRLDFDPKNIHSFRFLIFVLDNLEKGKLTDASIVTAKGTMSAENFAFSGMDHIEVQSIVISPGESMRNQFLLETLLTGARKYQ